MSQARVGGLGGTTGLVAGRSTYCPFLAGSVPGYVAVFFDSVGSNYAVQLLSESMTTRVKVGSNSDFATVLMETDFGLVGVYSADGGVSFSQTVLSIFPAATESPRGFLADVQQLGDATGFVYAVTNHNAHAAELEPVGGDGRYLLPPNTTALIWSRWAANFDISTQAVRLLEPGRPLGPVLLNDDPSHSKIYLAATCPAALDGGMSAFCTSDAAQHVVVELPPP